MLCEKCGKNVATTHIRTVVNGVSKEKHLCSECAKNENIAALGDNGLSGMLASMFGDVLSVNHPDSENRCKCCGSTFSDIANKGKAGCPECYKTFYGEFLPYIKRVHGSVKHIGKTPMIEAEAKKEQPDTVSSLKEKLSKLISEEKFEQAAQVRDRIRELEGRQ